MKQEMIIAGFGGQGVMLMGQLIAYAGMMEGMEVSWLPSYGPEMRGGTANCHVIVSNEPIASPFVTEPDTVIAMNLPSMEKFAPSLKAGGTLIFNSSLIAEKPDTEGVDILEVPANDIAGQIGEGRVANMVVLGAFLAKTGILPPETIKSALKNVLPERHHRLIPINEEALAQGSKLVKA